jgi:tetratricopeptide (TPR) repeat protein
MAQQVDEGGSLDPIKQEPLQQAEYLFWHGKFPEAMEQLERLRIREDVSETKLLKGLLLKCRIFALLDIKKAQNLAIQVVKSSQDLNQPFIGVDALLIMAEGWLELGKLETSMDFVNQGKAMLATISHATTADLTAREAMILALEGGIYAWKDRKHAIEYARQSLTLRKKQDNPQTIAHSLYYLAKASLHKIDSFEYIQQSLTLREQLGIPQEIA